MASYIRGIDVSRYQGTINFDAVRRDGVVFVAQRWGVGNYRDPSRISNLRAVIAAGLIPGAYFVPGENTGTGTQQAQRFVAEVRQAFPHQPMLHVMDAETSTTWGDPTRRQCADFCNEIRRLTGRKTLGYIPKWWMTGQGWFTSDVAAVAENALWWQSAYPTSPDLSDPPPSFAGWTVTLWQYTSRGRVAGIAGECDLDVFYGSLNELRALAGYPQSEEDDMTPEQAQQLDEIHQALPALERGQPPGYFAKVGDDGTVYYVADNHQSKLTMPVGGDMHEWLKVLHRLSGFNDRAVVVEQTVLDAIPDAA